MTIGQWVGKAQFVQVYKNMTVSHFSSEKILTFGHFWNILYYIERESKGGAERNCTRQPAAGASYRKE